MEFRRYWHVVRRRMGLILLLLLVVLISYGLWHEAPDMAYAAGMRFVVGIQPEPASDDYYQYDRYYTWLTAEYLVDDLSEVVKSQAFAEDVAELAGIDVPTGAIQGATSAGKLHRILTVTVTWHDVTQLEQLAKAVVAALQERGGDYFAQLSTENARVQLIDPPAIAPVGRSLRQRLDLPLRLAIALAAGIGLAFLLDYLDDTVRESADLRALGLDTLGQIPPLRRWSWRLRNRQRHVSVDAQQGMQR